jgi:hypothetical protein
VVVLVAVVAELVVVAVAGVLAVVAVVVREAAVPSSPRWRWSSCARWRWSSWSRCGGGGLVVAERAGCSRIAAPRGASPLRGVGGAGVRS